MAKLKYSTEIAVKMYNFFKCYDDLGAPSITKFALSIGTSTERLEGFRRHKDFDRVYRECCEIRRDYLIDRALSKRFDPSFVKFLLSGEELTENVTEEFKLSLSVTE